MRKVTNKELIEKYNQKQKRGNVASEMCRRAGTIRYLLNHCVKDNEAFNSCMKDTITVLSRRPEEKY